MLFRILRNVAALLTGQVLSKIFSLTCIIFLARRLGVEGFGAYGAIMAYLSLFTVFADNGLSTVTTREIAQDHACSLTYFSHTVVLRLGMTVWSYGIMLALGHFGGILHYPFLFIATCGLFLFPELFHKVGTSMLAGYERMDIIAGLELVSVIIRYVPFLLAIGLQRSLHWAFSLLVILWFGVAAIWLLVTKHYCLSSRFAPLRIKTFRNILYEAFPFGIYFVLSVIYFKADILMLSGMQGETAVGFYEGAYKFIEAAMFIPVSIVNVLLPAMSKSLKTDKNSYANLYVQSTRILAMGILPVVILISFFAKPIILLVYDASYLPSALALSLLIWSLFIIFLNAPVGNVIVTAKLMHRFLPFAVANTVLNIILNLFLIPRYSFLGAAFTTVLTECTGFVLQLWFAHRAIGNAVQVLEILGKLLIVGAVTSLMCYGLKSLVTLPLTLVLVMGTYFVCLLAVKLINAEDKNMCLEIFQLVKNKL